MRSIESRPGPYNGERVHSVFDGGVGGLAPTRYIGRRGYRPLAHTVTADFIVELFDPRGLPPYHIGKATGDHEGEARFTVGGGAPGKSPQAGIYAIGVLSEGDWSATISSNDAQ